MKGIYRNKIILAVLVIGSIGTAIYVASEKNAATDNNSAMTGSPTMESLQNDLLDYLKENHPEIRFGSQKYIDYVSDVCILAEADPEIMKIFNFTVRNTCMNWMNSRSKESFLSSVSNHLKIFCQKQ